MIIFFPLFQEPHSHVVLDSSLQFYPHRFYLCSLNAYHFSASQFLHDLSGFVLVVPKIFWEEKIKFLVAEPLIRFESLAFCYGFRFVIDLRRYKVYFICHLSTDFICVQNLIFELLVLLGLRYNEIFHQQFEVGLPRNSDTNLSFKVRRSHSNLGRVILLRKNWMVSPSRVLGVRLRIVSLVTIIIINGVLANSSCEYHFPCSISVIGYSKNLAC